MRRYRSAKLANAHEFIMHLEHGYQTILSGDGSSLSQDNVSASYCCHGC
ncbi:MAG: hypothetical protein ACLS85_00530 [Coprobacillus cateniformis]